MARRRRPVLIRIGPPIALVLVLCAGCTPGGQFDPTSIFANDMFDTKTKLKGEREPVFPNGVPGAENGVPPELVKGYQPPPDQTADTGSSAPGAPPAPGTDAAAPAAEAAAKPKPKPKPRPKLARAPAQSQDPAFEQKPPTRITVGPKAAAPAAPARSDNSVWPAPPPTGPAQKAAGPSDSIWPAPPQTAPAKQTAQPAQPAQPAWPNPPATSNQ